MSTLQNLNELAVNGWQEPIQSVQLLAESGLTYVPSQYVRPHSERPEFTASPAASSPARLHDDDQQAPRGVVCVNPEEVEARGESLSIPVLDMGDLDREERRQEFLEELSRACEEWGVFHVKNHGVEKKVVEGVRSAAGEFFKLPMQEKQVYANDPVTYQGYGSRLGISKEAVLDWRDYFFINLHPAEAVDRSKWPTNPPHWRDMVEKYTRKVVILFKKIQGALSMSLGLQGEERGKRRLEQAFGEVDMGLCINYYPPCPQPQLTLGLSPHSDPGGLTILLQDHQVGGLQIKHPSSATWVNVPLIPDSLVVNLGDQMQVLTNGKFKSVEHRVVVNRSCERLSLACFLNPNNETIVAPLSELVPKDELPAYNAMKFKEYRSFIRNGGIKGKAHLTSIASPTSINPRSIVKNFEL